MPPDASNLHKDAFVADLHSDTVLQMKRGYDIALRHSENHIDIPRLIEGGVNLQVFACFVGFDTPEETCPAETDELLDILQGEFERLSDKIDVCLTSSEARTIVKSGKIAAFLGIENGMAINNDLALLDHFHKRGVRYMTLIHNRSNEWCIASNDTSPAFAGLTDFGCDVVHRMNELGMIVDISHVHPLGVEKVLEVTTKPIIASHSCAHAICPHNRNLTDEQLRALADNGGMVGINYHGDFISRKRWAMSRAIEERDHELKEEIMIYYFSGPDSSMDQATRDRFDKYIIDWENEIRPVNPNLSEVVDHIDYVAKLIGDDYVGLGSDYDGIFLPPDGLDDTAKVPGITDELIARGYTEGSAKKILGENFLRVFRDNCG
ncbi:MAG: dipeptidase [candidate division Zixibacteria bacterium]|nr:dipeptidase [candidate division Zixibacteria bacterium]